MRFSISLIALSVLVTNLGIAAVAVPAQTVVAQPTPAQQSTLIGEVDIRPSMLSDGEDSFRTENYTVLGIKPDATTSILYHQDFHTNLFSSQPDLVAKDGYAKLGLDNIYQNGNVSLSYALRLYAPTDTAKRDAGMLTAVRNYITLTQKLNEKVSLSLSEVPIFHAYSQASNGLEGDKLKANPIFENRVVLAADYQITDALSFSLPVTYYMIKRRAGTSAVNDNKWDFVIDIAPELTYAITPNYSLGVAYYNDSNLLARFGEALDQSVFQLVFNANL